MGKTQKDRRDVEEGYRSKNKVRKERPKRNTNKFPRNWSADELFEDYSDIVDKEH